MPKIKRQGFAETPGLTTGQHFGQGTYLTEAEAYAYNFAGSNPGGVLETRVAATNPANPKETHDIVAAVKARHPRVEDVPRLVREEAIKRGFDALTVTDYFTRRGHRELESTTNVVVFDPHKVVVVDK